MCNGMYCMYRYMHCIRYVLYAYVNVVANEVRKEEKGVEGGESRD